MSDATIKPRMEKAPLGERVIEKLPVMLVPALALLGLIAVGNPATWLTLTVAGLAMIGVLLSAFQNAFGKSLGNQTGAFVALAVAMSNVSLLGISAPFWALVAGVIVSALVEAGRIGEKQAA